MSWLSKKLKKSKKKGTGIFSWGSKGAKVIGMGANLIVPGSGLVVERTLSQVLKKGKTSKKNLKRAIEGTSTTSTVFIKDI